MWFEQRSPQSLGGGHWGIPLRLITPGPKTCIVRTTACLQPTCIAGRASHPTFPHPQKAQRHLGHQDPFQQGRKGWETPHYSPPHPHSQHLLPHPRTCRSRTSSRFAPGISCGSEVPGCCRRSKNPQPAQRRGFSSSDKAHSASGVRKHSSIGRSEKKTNPAPSVK